MQSYKGKNYFAKVIFGIMTLTLMIWPFGWTAKYSWDLYMKITSGYWVAIPVFIISIIVINWLIYKEYNTIDPKAHRKAAILLFLVSGSIRLVCAVNFQNKPISDFAQCYEFAANGGGDANFLARFPYLGMYSLTLRKWFSWTSVSVFSAQLLNILVTSCIPVLIYYTVFRVTKKSNLALIGGLSYALFPSMIIYTAIPSCENMSQFFLMLTLYLLVVSRQTENPKYKYPLYAATGLALGLMYCYKELFIIVAPAILMASFCYEIIPEMVLVFKEKMNRTREILSILLCGFLIVIVAITSYHIVIGKVQNSIVGHEIIRNSSTGVRLAKIMYQGLALPGRGAYDQEAVDYIYEVEQLTNSDEERIKMLMDALIEDYREDSFNEIKETFFFKSKRNWGGEGAYFNWVMPNGGNYKKTIADYLLFANYPQVYFGMFCLILSIGMFICTWKRNELINQQIRFVTVGCVFLYALASILMEVQGRYKSNFIPLFCVLFAFSVGDIAEVADSLWQKFRLKLNALRSK